MAKEINMRTIAITDHDTVAGVEEAIIAGKEYGIEVIPGIEMSVDYDGIYEILGYNIDYKNEEFLSKLEQRKTWREERMFKTVELMNTLGYDIKVEEVEKIANGATIGRPHIAKALIDRGYFNNIKEVFNELLAEGKKGYVKAKAFSIKEVIEIIIKAGGAPVLAHPYMMSFNVEELEEEIKKLVSYGLKGIEALYSESTLEKNKFHLELAQKYNLIFTCGSDFHGGNKRREIGKIIEDKGMIDDYSIIEKLKSITQN